MFYIIYLQLSIDTESLTDLEKIQYVKLLFPYVLAKNKEVDVTSDFVEQPIFEVNVLDSSDIKELH